MERTRGGKFYFTSLRENCQPRHQNPRGCLLRGIFARGRNFLAAGASIELGDERGKTYQAKIRQKFHFGLERVENLWYADFRKTVRREGGTAMGKMKTGRYAPRPLGHEPDG